MPCTFSVDEAKNRLIESESPIQLAQTDKADFWTAYLAFRQQYQLGDLALDPDTIFADVRDRSPGRDVKF